MATRSLITGGAGFLGSHLCQLLLNRGDEVICLDNLFTSRMETIEPLLAHERFSFVEHDVTEPYKIESDFIFNLACPAAPGHYQYDPVYTLKKYMETRKCILSQKIIVGALIQLV